MVKFTLKSFSVFVALLFLSLSSGIAAYHAHTLQKELTEVRLLNAATLSDLETVKNSKVKLNELYTGSQEEIAILNAALITAKSKPAEIRYVVKTETRVVKESSIFYDELPQEHLFKGTSDLVVARFAQENGFQFQTYDVVLDGYLVITKRNTSLSIHGTSSYDPEYTVEIPVRLSVQEVQNASESFLAPRLHIGIAGTLPLDLRASLGLTTLQYKDFRFAGIIASGNKNSFGLGFAPVLYNIGTPLPLVTDLYLGAGFGVNQSLSNEGFLLLSTEL